MRPETETPVPDATRHCHLWNPPATRWEVLDALEVVETYLQDYHETQQLMRCKDCGQLYFCEWREVMNFSGDNDSQDYVLIPVSNAVEGLTTSKKTRFDRMGLPCLVMIWPPADAKPYWVNR